MRGTKRVSAAALAVLSFGLALTATFVLTTRSVHRDNEERLTRERTREAGSVLAAGIPNLSTPLVTTAALAEVVINGDAGAFRDALGPQISPESTFASGALWPLDGSAPAATIGEAPLLASEPQATIAAYLARAKAAPGKLTVFGHVADRRLGYAIASPRPDARFVLYAERALPAQPGAAQRPDSPFQGLDYAIYLGDQERDDQLLFASTTQLPMRGTHASDTVPLGDTTLLLVMAPSSELGGTLLARLPWIVLGTGLFLSISGAALIEALQRRRRRAEELAAENQRLYAQQRSAAESLQEGLLPTGLPEVAGVELGARYSPGVAGIEIGGDWYDAFAVDGRLFFVVGDVSGRGLLAANVMAALRFSMRAVAQPGDGPGAVLTRLDALKTIEFGGHFATIICASIDVGTRDLVVASAGHPPPLLIESGRGRFAPVTIGPPIGVAGGARYGDDHVELNGATTTLLLSTDGLVERRGEVLDVGLERLRAVASAAPHDLEAMLDHIVDALFGDADDDAAMLAVRWEP